MLLDVAVLFRVPKRVSVRADVAVLFRVPKRVSVCF